MVQRFLPKEREVKGSTGTLKPDSDGGSRIPSHIFQPCHCRDQTAISLAVPCRYDVLLLNRSGGGTRVFTVNETQRPPQEVDLHDWLEQVQGQTTRVRSGPRGGPHSLYKANGSRQRKRSIPHRSACPPTKRQKPYEHASSAAQTDGEDGSVSGAEGESDGSLEDERATVQEAISVSRLWVDYYRPALKILGQLACKDIAKAWIKSCCEKKQTTNPYNGGDTKDLSMQLHGYEGALTAPVWWPRQGGWEHGEGCRHKEPDHILKPERLYLMRHLLCSGLPDFPVDKLRSATLQIKRDNPKHFPPGSVRILKDIYDTRATEIRYENGEIDGDSWTYVTMPKPPVKAQKASKRATSPLIKRERSPQGPSKRTTTRVPVADMGTGAHSEGEQCIAAQMKSESPRETKANSDGSTPASATSSATQGGVSLKTVPKGIRSSQPDLPMAAVAPNMPIRQRSHRRPGNARRYFQQDAPCRATLDCMGGLPLESPPEYFPQATTKQAPNVLERDKMSKSLGSSQSSHGDTASCESRLTSIASRDSRENRDFKQARAAQQSRPLHNPFTSTNPVNNYRQTVAPLPTDFSGSSSGLAGLSSDDSWQTSSDLWTAQPYEWNGPAWLDYTDSGNTFPAYSSDATTSFGSNFAENPAENGHQMFPWSEPLHAYQSQDRQGVEAELQQQNLSYLPLGLNTLSMESGHSDDSAMLQSGSLMGTESKYFPPT